MTPSTLPLSGVRIADFTRVLTGPFATMLLGDLGADVIKVEPPGGDDTRAWGPPFQVGEGGRESSYTDSVYFANNPELHRIAGSTSGTRFSPSRIRSD